MIKTLLQFIKFGIVGFLNTIISYVIYALLTYLGVYYVISNIIGFIASVLNSFFWNNRYVFKKSDDEKRNPWWTLVKTFLAYSSTGLVLANVLLVLFVDKLEISKYIAPTIILVVTIPLNFLINKFWSFKTMKVKNNDERKNEKNNCSNTMLQ